MGQAYIKLHVSYASSSANLAPSPLCTTMERCPHGINVYRIDKVLSFPCFGSSLRLRSPRRLAPRDDTGNRNTGS